MSGHAFVIYGCYCGERDWFKHTEQILYTQFEESDHLSVRFKHTEQILYTQFEESDHLSVRFKHTEQIQYTQFEESDHLSVTVTRHSLPIKYPKLILRTQVRKVIISLLFLFLYPHNRFLKGCRGWVEGDGTFDKEDVP